MARGGGSTPGGGVVGDEIPGGRLGTGGRFCACAILGPIVNVESAKINDAKAGSRGVWEAITNLLPVLGNELAAIRLLTSLFVKSGLLTINYMCVTR